MTKPTPLAALTLCLALLVGCAQSPTRLEPQSAASSAVVSFPASLELNGENVNFTGTVHLVSQPSKPIRILTNLAGVRGVGQTTGAVYRVTGASSHTFIQLPPSSYTFVAAYRLLPPSPIRLLPPNPIRPSVSLAFGVTLDEGGSISKVDVTQQVISEGDF